MEESKSLNYNHSDDYKLINTIEEKNKSQQKIKYLILEPFYGGSHKVFVDLLRNQLFSPDLTMLISLPDRKWHWKMTASSLYFAQKIPEDMQQLKLIMTSDLLNLSELIALRPDLSKIRKIIYFHENQLIYPIREFISKEKAIKTGATSTKKRDFHYGWTQVISCLCATEVYFNSNYNRNSFLEAIPVFLNKPTGFLFDIQDVINKIKIKSTVLYFPVSIPCLHLRIPKSKILEKYTENTENTENIKNTETREKINIEISNEIINIVWNHRWEYDKGPEIFFDVIKSLSFITKKFKVIVLGEAFKNIPPIFEEMKEFLGERNYIKHWGFVTGKEEYFRLLNEGDIVISTGIHEFYGVSIIEAILCGCYPLCPNNLVYPEYLPNSHLYNTPKHLLKKLKNLICFQKEKLFDRAALFQDTKLELFLWENQKDLYVKHILRIKKKKLD